jgi:hypothetical protein
METCAAVRATVPFGMRHEPCARMEKSRCEDRVVLLAVNAPNARHVSKIAMFKIKTNQITSVVRPPKTR